MLTDYVNMEHMKNAIILDLGSTVVYVQGVLDRSIRKKLAFFTIDGALSYGQEVYAMQWQNRPANFA